MKLELKTENEIYSKSFAKFFGIILITSLIIIFCDAANKLGIISRHYEIDHTCKLLSIDKAPNNFKKLSILSNLKSKQRIWQFCKEVIK